MSDELTIDLSGYDEGESSDYDLTVEEAQVEAHRVLLSHAYRYRSDMERARQGFTPPMLTEAWIAGLKAAGVDARKARVWEGGKYPTTKPMAIEFPCPFWHRTEDEAGFQTVRLIVLDDGWVKRYAGHCCTECTSESLERWLLTCPGCEAGWDCWEGMDGVHPHPSSEPCHYLGESHVGDRSIVHTVAGVFRAAAALACAIWWRDYPSEAEAEAEDQVRATFSTQPEEWIRRAVSARRERALRPLEQTPAPPHAAEKKRRWTTEDAAQWLTEHGVEASLGQTAAWERVKEIPGHPPQSVVRAAQAQRRSE